LPVPLVILALIFFALFDYHRISAPPYLLPLLNIGILFGGGLAAAALAAWGYRAGGTRAVLLLGGAMLTLGLGSLAAAILVPRGMLNAAVTVYNLGALLAGMLHLVSALEMSLPRLAPPSIPPRYRHVIWLYGGSVLVMALITVLAVQQRLPVFLGPHGSTLIRALILDGAETTLLIAAGLFGVQSRRTGAPFLAWYWSGLALIGLGINAVSLADVGSLLSWVGRLAQMLGQAYLLISLIVVRAPRAPPPSANASASPSAAWSWNTRPCWKPLPKASGSSIPRGSFCWLTGSSPCCSCTPRMRSPVTRWRNSWRRMRRLSCTRSPASNSNGWNFATRAPAAGPTGQKRIPRR
jgi:hypothetical protein